MATGSDVRQPLEFSGSVSPRPAVGESVHALLRVTEPEYIPQGISLRTRIDPRLFTCTFPGDALTRLAADPRVQTIALSQPVRLADRVPQGGNRLRAFRESLNHLASVVGAELATLPNAERATIAAWLRGTDSTGPALIDVREQTFRFRFRPAVWTALQGAYQAAGTDNLAPVANLIDLRGLGPLLLDNRQEP